MDQVLVSVCCHSQNEHINIKKVANSRAGVILKSRQNTQKFMFFFFFIFVTPFFVQAVSQELL